MIEQRTLEWQRERLGFFTASRIGDLMKKGRKKDEVFGDTAMSYIYKVAANRLLDRSMVDDDVAFEEYLEDTEVTSKAIRWGVRWEPEARERYAEMMGVEVVECGSIVHKKLSCLSCSPDGLVGDDGLIEIKCQQPETFTKSASAIAKGVALKDINEMHFWQVMAQLAVTEREWCDYVIYHPYIAPKIKICRVERDDEAISSLLERVALAEQLVEEHIRIINDETF